MKKEAFVAAFLLVLGIFVSLQFEDAEEAIFEEEQSTEWMKPSRLPPKGKGNRVIVTATFETGQKKFGIVWNGKHPTVMQTTNGQASALGFLPGDKLHAVDGMRVPNSIDRDTLQTVLLRCKCKISVVRYLHDAKKECKHCTPAPTLWIPHAQARGNEAPTMAPTRGTVTELCEATMTELITYEKVGSKDHFRGCLKILVDTKNDKLNFAPNQLGDLTDKFLTQRPWLEVHTEPSDDHPEIGELVLVQRPQKVANALMDIARIQYPDECGAVAVFREEAYWGSLMDLMHLAYKKARDRGALLMPYITMDNGPDGWPGLVDRRFCDKTGNKMPCYFLPATSCAPPPRLARCTSASCMPQPMSALHFYDSVGEPVSDPPLHHQPTAYQAAEFQNQNHLCRAKHCKPMGQGVDLFFNAVTNVFFTRMNFRARRVMGAILDDMRKKEQDKAWAPPCVTVQIRRGDKIPGKHTWNPTDCGKKNYGDPRCTYDSLYKNTFDDYMDEARRQLGAIGGKSVFVMTDDPYYVRARMGAYSEKYGLHISLLGGHGQPRGDNPANATTESMLFFESLLVGSQCQRFVGDFSSSVSIHVYKQMCVRNEDLVCPTGINLQKKNSLGGGGGKQSSANEASDESPTSDGLRYWTKANALADEPSTFSPAPNCKPSYCPTNNWNMCCHTAAAVAAQACEVVKGLGPHCAAHAADARKCSALAPSLASVQLPPELLQASKPKPTTCEASGGKGGGETRVYRPYLFGIPGPNIAGCVPAKRKDFAVIIPDPHRKTYIFGSNTLAYYREYRVSYFAITRPKFGWDCWRHYEILAAGAVPYFLEIERSPSQTLALLPKQLLLQLRNLPGVPKLSVRDIGQAANGNATAKALLAIDHSKFDKQKYFQLAAQLLKYTQEHLSSEAVVRYMIESTGNGAVLSKHDASVLFVADDTFEDFAKMSVLSGLKSLFGHKAVDVVKQMYMYDTAELTKKRGTLMGAGLGWAGFFPDDPRCDRENIRVRIRKHEFDLVFIHEHRRGRYPPLYHHLIDKAYKKQELYLIDGTDVPANSKAMGLQAANYEGYAGLGHAFVRELPDGCPNTEKVRPGSNYRDSVTGGWNLGWPLASTTGRGKWKLDAQGLPMYYGPLKDAWMEDQKKLRKRQ